MTAAMLEERICAAVGSALAALAPGMARQPVVRGRWQKAGFASRGPELKPVGVAVEVAVAPPAFERFELNKATFDCSVETRFENASKLAAETTVAPVCAALEELLAEWLMDGGKLAADLAFEGCRPFAFVPTGGEAPAYDEKADEWVFAHRFRLSAVVYAD